MIDLVDETICPNCGCTLACIKEERMVYPTHKPKDGKRKYWTTKTPLWYDCPNCQARYILVTLQRVDMVD